jgi:hypothetical protein
MTPTPRTQSTLALAYADRHDGQAANIAANLTGHRDHRTIVGTALDILARNPKPFTADDIHRLVAHELPDGYDRNLVSSVMGVAAQHGHIVEADRRPVPSRNRSRRASRNRWWLGAAVRDAA